MWAALGLKFWFFNEIAVRNGNVKGACVGEQIGLLKRLFECGIFRGDEKNCVLRLKGSLQIVILTGLSKKKIYPKKHKSNKAAMANPNRLEGHILK
jgi:hypothetical protein